MASESQVGRSHIKKDRGGYKVSNDLVVQDELSVEDVRKQVAKVQLLMKDLMQKDEH